MIFRKKDEGGVKSSSVREESSASGNIYQGVFHGITLTCRHESNALMPTAGVGNHFIFGVGLGEAAKAANLKKGDQCTFTLVGREPFVLPNGKPAHKNIWHASKV